MAKEYQAGGFMGVLNGAMKTVLKLGFGPPGIALLSVPGRKTGRMVETPVSPVTRSGITYVVSPYGVRGWARNVRAAGRLNLGRGKHAPEFRAIELAPTEAAPILRQYWHEQKVTRPYFDVTETSPDQAWEAEAPRHPVFRLEAA